MILTGPTPVVFIPSTQSAVVGVELVIDMVAHTIMTNVRVAGAPPMTDITAIPPVLLTALQTMAKNRAEALLGWANGSSTITTP